MLNTTTTETKANVPVSDQTDSAQDDESEDEEPRAAVPPQDYRLGDEFEKTIGNASSICECCGDPVDGHDLDEFIVSEFDRVDFSTENHVLLCRGCNERDDWEARVRERRRNQQINSRLDKLAHWVTRPPAETLFLRRAATGAGLLLAATSLVTVMAVIESGLAVFGGIPDVLSVVRVGAAGSIAVGAGYWLHVHEREENDRRGTTVRDYETSSGPWSILAAGSAGFVVGSILVAGGFSETLTAFGLTVYLGGAVFAFVNAETAVRADRCLPRVNWTPRYDRELFGLRVSIILGTGALVGGFALAGLVPAVAIGAYLYTRKWYDLGPRWKMLYYDSDSSQEGGDYE